MRDDGYDSYMPVLEWACRTVEPRRVLEWGPGDSTECILAECPQATALSVEHDWHYAQAAKARFGDRVRVEWVKHSHVACHAQGYATYPLRVLQSPYDLVFIDGRDRVNCLTVARLLVAPTGVVLLHDADRPNYRAGVTCYPYSHYVHACETAVLSLSSELIDLARKAFP